MVAQLLLGGTSPLLPPTSPASIPPQAAGLRQQPAVPPHIPSSCCPPATSTSRWHGELHQWESSQGSLVYGKKQKWSMCHLCKQPGAPQRRKNTWRSEAPHGGGDYLPCTSALQEGVAGAVYLVIPVSDVPEQKALKMAEGPGKRGFRESIHIHGLKCSSPENHLLRCCHDSHGNASRVVCPPGVSLPLISCSLKDEQQDRDWAPRAFCGVFRLDREWIGFVHPTKVSIHF